MKDRIIKSYNRCINIFEPVDLNTIAQSTSRLNEFGEFLEKQVKCRRYPDFLSCRPSEIDLFDISPQQAAGVSAACIPFLEHDYGHRALMGTNMLSQAVPLLYPEIPLVMTGMERYAALDSAQLLRSDWNGNIIYADGTAIDLRTDFGAVYTLRMKKYLRSNYGTCINQKPAVRTGQDIKAGDVLADAACTEEVILALGHNPVIAFMCWDGYNFEDAIAVSEKLIREDKFTSIDIIRFEAKAFYTEAGLEEITRDIPGTNPKNLYHLDERGIARIGTVLKGGDVIIGKVSPRREDDFDDEISEDISMKTIFGEKASKYKDTSIRLPKYMKATVIDVKVLTHEDMPDMETLTEMIVRVTVVKKRKLEPGDKMSGRHGKRFNKQILSYQTLRDKCRESYNNLSSALSEELVLDFDVAVTLPDRTQFSYAVPARAKKLCRNKTPKVMNEKRLFARVMEYVDRTNSCPEAKDLVQKTLELFEKPEMQQLFSEFFKYCIFYRNMRNKLIPESL